MPSAACPCASQDLIFVLDICFQFRIAYASTHEDDERRWILDSSQIIRHYGCSAWFAIDLFSFLVSLFDIVGDEGTENLKALRAVRTLRLVKLIKLARGSRIFKRWEVRSTHELPGLRARDALHAHVHARSHDRGVRRGCMHLLRGDSCAPRCA